MIERLRQGEGARLRAIRLRALADAPEAFSATFATAAKRDAEAWEAQVVALPTFVWREGDADLGMVRGAVADEDPTSAYLLSMWVAPEARGRGIGAALVDEVVAWARGRGLRRLLLDVGEHNVAAQGLYERCGFVTTGPADAPPPGVERGCELAMAIDLTPPLHAPSERPLDVALLPARLAVCRLPAGSGAPGWLEADASFVALTRTDEETSVVCREASVPEGVRGERGWRAIRVAGPLDFALTGVLLSLVRPLAAAQVAVFVVSTFDTDYVLVKEAALDDALAALAAAGHRIAPPLGGG